ncbi:hypothetical protein QEH59_00440 [Coraliomargarita sp. SDUM461004]|uniref:STAS/SEC14 domain-containing protein n=1 Tax=Thalassobacterium sedimentorum TaxID=3041258 RepID=A0ABU1ADV0_9BACT|nr:hypothetical protein [Coraliomargarita sp. SDUM461004]MDQ8192871.1 hypothetical protein [Coraliomargarita sp. SDUM461004]
MKYALQFIPEHRLVIETITGDITLEGMIEKTQSLLSHPDYNRLYSGLVDLRSAVTRISKVEILGFAQLIDTSEQFGHAPWAILCGDPMIQGLSQVFQMRQTSPESIGVFTTVADAAKFLDRPIILELLND